MSKKHSVGASTSVALVFLAISLHGWPSAIPPAQAQNLGADAQGVSDGAPGNSANAPGLSGGAPGNSANAPGLSGGAPGNSANAPGLSGAAPGNSANAPGLSGGGPRNSANAPGLSVGGAADSVSDVAPDNAADALGRSVGVAADSADALVGEVDLGGSRAASRTEGLRSFVDRIFGGGRRGPGAAPAAPAGTSVASDAGPSGPQTEPPQAADAPQIRPRFRPSGEPQGEERVRANEISVVGLDAGRINALRNAGFETIASRSSSVLGNRQVTRLATPAGLSPAQAADLVRQSFPGTIADLSHLYRPAAQPKSVRYAQQLVGVDQPRCAAGTRLGLIDTGVGEHVTLRRAQLTERTFVDLRTGGNLTHGTAVASLLVGELPGVDPLVSGSRLYSANVFSGVQGVLATDVTAIIEALDWMAANRVRVVNLSLIGPPNELLEAAVLGAAQKGMILVAAAGNDGPSAPPAYPAAYDTVIGVSAVDARARPYANSNRGSYVEIAAPGVDIWAANADGGGAFWTGTSFAVPFVTAVLARQTAAGTVSNINDARTYLRASSRDLGARGRDPVYGYGLLQAGTCGR